MDATPILESLTRHECRFVVVGSTARSLLGDPVVPRDLDLVVDRVGADQNLIDALAEMEALIRRRVGWRPIRECGRLPWEWGWQGRTRYGDIDVITQFIDGATFVDHDAVAEPVRLASGAEVRCHATQHLP